MSGGEDGRAREPMVAKNPLDQLYRRPGFLIRRAHQIAVSLFLEETGDLGITNRQYGILLVLKRQPKIDQITVAKLLGLDRSTTGMVLTKLEAGGIGRPRHRRERPAQADARTDAGRRTHASAACRAGAPRAGTCAVGVHSRRAAAVPQPARQVHPRVQRFDAGAARGPSGRRRTQKTERQTKGRRR